MNRRKQFYLSVALALAVTVCGAGFSESGSFPGVPYFSGEAFAADRASRGNGSPEAAQAHEKADESIEEQVILDRDGVRITAQELYRDAYSMPKLRILVENDSGKDLKVRACDVSVNRCMNDARMLLELNSGENAVGLLEFNGRELGLCGVGTIQEIELSFNAYEKYSYRDLFYSDPVTLHTKAEGSFIQADETSGGIAYDVGGLKIVAKGLEENSSFGGPEIIVGFENRRDRKVSILVDRLSVNGIRVQPFFSAEVMPGKRGVAGIVIPEYELQKNGIEGIDTVDLSFTWYEGDDIAESVYTDPVTIRF